MHDSGQAWEWFKKSNHMLVYDKDAKLWGCYENMSVYSIGETKESAIISAYRYEMKKAREKENG